MSGIISSGPSLPFAMPETPEYKKVEDVLKILRSYPGFIKTLVELGNEAHFVKESLDLTDLLEYVKQSQAPVSQ